jgi:hypothetical protein
MDDSLTTNDLLQTKLLLKNKKYIENYIINMIVKSINDTEKKNNSNFLSIFNRAFKYDYKDIVKELRDRLIFKNICYLGKPEQFLGDVNYLKGELKKIGLNFQILPREKWNDYSKVDAVVAVRPVYDSNHKKISSNLSLNKKPPSKLTNAWIAGVPAILSPDDAFLKLKKSEYDFLEAKNADELISQIKLLKDNRKLIDKMIKNGFQRSKKIQLNIIAKQWDQIIQKKVIPNYLLWRKSFWRRFFLFVTRLFFYPKLLRFIYRDTIKKNYL